MKLPWTLLASIAVSTTHVTSTPAKRYYSTHNYYVLEHAGERDAAGRCCKQSRRGSCRAGGRATRYLASAGAKATARAARQGIRSCYCRLRGSTGPGQLTFVIAVRGRPFCQANCVVCCISGAPNTTRTRQARATISGGRLLRPSAVAQRLGLQDPLFTEQWHLVNEEFPEHMMNATPVWDMGLTGKGVLTSFLDDGLDFESDDLKDAVVR